MWGPENQEQQSTLTQILKDTPSSPTRFIDIVATKYNQQRDFRPTTEGYQPK